MSDECDLARAKLEAAGNKLSGLKKKSNMNERMSALSESVADFERRIVDGSGLVVTHEGEVSSTKAAAGNIYGLSPWRLVDLWDWTREPDLDDFVLR